VKETIAIPLENPDQLLKIILRKDADLT
jgi:hypothetical protein